MKSRMVEALDNFENSLVEYCRRHTLKPTEAQRGKVLVPTKDQKVLQDEIKKLEKLERLKRLKGARFGTAH